MTEIFFVDVLPTGVKDACYVDYDHAPSNTHNWRQVDIRGTISEVQAEWVDDFDTWHAALGRQAEDATHWWWLVAASRLNLWSQQPTLKPLFVAAAVAEWCAAHTDQPSLYVVGCPVEVRLYLSEFGLVSQTKTPTAYAALQLIKGMVAGGIVILRRAARMLLLNVPRQPRLPRGSTLFYSHVVSAIELAEKGDHFFGSMIDAAVSRAPGDVSVTYVLDDESERADVAEILKANSYDSCFLLDQLTLMDLFWVIAACLRAWMALFVIERRLPPVRLGCYLSRTFNSIYVACEVLKSPPIVELAIYRSMSRVLARTQVRSVVYPYEEKGLERALLKACSSTREVETIGYAHAVHTQAHLALRTRPAGMSNPPLPSRLLATGSFAREFLVSWGRKDKDYVTTVGSPRSGVHLPTARKHADRRKSLRILLIISHGFELTMFCNLAQQQPGLFDRSELIVRKYPFASYGQDIALARLADLKVHFGEDSRSLHQQLGWCDVALFSSTTAGIEAMLGGRLGIHVALHDIFEADPLKGRTAGFERCETVTQLASALERARALTDQEYAGIVRAQIDLAATILAPLDIGNKFNGSLRDKYTRP